MNTNNKKFNSLRKKEVKILDNLEFKQINETEILKNWKKEEKKGKNMAIFESKKLYKLVISRSYISKIKK